MGLGRWVGRLAVKGGLREGGVLRELGAGKGERGGGESRHEWDSIWNIQGEISCAINRNPPNPGSSALWDGSSCKSALWNGSSCKSYVGMLSGLIRNSVAQL